jgi:hypothetical protein
MPRRNRPPKKNNQQPEERLESRIFSIEIAEEWSDGNWIVRKITGSGSTKNYRCPGCDHEIRPATPHTLSYLEGYLDERRHWHTACWERDRRLHERLED